MSTPSIASADAKPTPFQRYIKPWLTPYYLMVAVMLGAVTTVFGVLTLALILIVANFNILGWIE